MRVMVYATQQLAVDTDDWATAFDEDNKPIEWDLSLLPEKCQCDPRTWTDGQQEVFRQWALKYVQGRAPEQLSPQIWRARVVHPIGVHR